MNATSFAQGTKLCKEKMLKSYLVGSLVG